MVNPKQSTGRPAGNQLAGRSVSSGLAFLNNADKIFRVNDSIQDKMQFAIRYSQMSDGELLKLSSEAWTLSDAAWEALEEELDRRNLEVPEGETPLTLDTRNLVMLRRFRDIPEALLAKGRLEAHGVECFLADENMVRMDWFISNLLGGVKLLVEPTDFSRASRILNEVPQNDTELEADEL